jgi:undecaprenyl-diphosphatase
VRYVRAWFRSVGARSIRTLDERVAWWIFAATIPAAIAGALGESVIEDHLGQPYQIAVFLAVFGVLLWLADRLPQEKQIGQLGFLAGLRHRRLTDPRPDAGGFALGHHDHGRPFPQARPRRGGTVRLLLQIPVVFGAVVYKGLKDVVLQPLPAGSVGPFVVGTMAAAAVGLIAIDLLLGYLRRHDYTPFVIYRLVLAAAIVIIIASGWRGAHF